MKHPPSYNEVEFLAPFVDNNENPTEQMDEYSTRFQHTFPNFPSEVISQWFYDHPQSLNQNSWLPFSLLNFSLVELTTSEIFDSCFSKNPIVDQYRNHFEEANTSPRMCRLSAYIIANSTWPVPPIVIANPESKIESPWGIKCDSPLHLLEGHHRFAVLHAYKSKIVLKPTHKLWVAKIGE